MKCSDLFWKEQLQIYPPTMSERASPVVTDGVVGHVLLDPGVLLRAELRPVAGVVNKESGLRGKELN